MKKIISSFIAIFCFTILANAQSKITFTETEFDFGKINVGVPVTHDFSFQNDGTIPLVIVSAQATCGCTTPEWPKQPVMAGQKNKIKVGYNAAAEGKFNKTIFVIIDGDKNPKELRITGEVINPTKTTR